MSGLKQNVCCVKSPMPGLLIALAILMMYKLHFWNLRSRSAAAGVAGNSAVVCVTVYIQMWENSSTYSLLTQHWVNFSFSWGTLTLLQTIKIISITRFRCWSKYPEWTEKMDRGGCLHLFHQGIGHQKCQGEDSQAHEGCLSFPHREKFSPCKLWLQTGICSDSNSVLLNNFWL